MALQGRGREGRRGGSEAKEHTTQGYLPLAPNPAEQISKTMQQMGSEGQEEDID